MAKIKKIVITGGHHNSALVVAEELRKRGYEIIWFGHKYTMWGDENVGAEYKEVTKAGFKFIEIKAGKFYRTYNPAKIALIPVGFFQSLYYLLKFKPNLVLSFGGYLAVPVIVCAWLLGIPSLTHEQTVVYGLANRIISHFAKKVLVSWETSVKHFPKNKAVFTGLPLRPEIFQRQNLKYEFNHKLPTIYITGGKQGAHVINQIARESLENLLKNYNIIHQCGSSSLYNDIRKQEELKKSLSEEFKRRYVVKEYFFREEIGAVFSSCDLVISRSGAHTVYELAALGKPSILIPIPWSSRDEQLKNAQILKNHGIAEIIMQKDLYPTSLLNMIEKMSKNIDFYKKNALRVKKLIKFDATQKIANIVQEAIL